MDISDFKELKLITKKQLEDYHGRPLVIFDIITCTKNYQTDNWTMVRVHPWIGDVNAQAEVHTKPISHEDMKRFASHRDTNILVLAVGMGEGVQNYVAIIYESKMGY